MVGVISERDLIKAVSYASLASFTPLMREKKIDAHAFSSMIRIIERAEVHDRLGKNRS
jgi:CBS domain-containing protein